MGLIDLEPLVLARKSEQRTLYFCRSSLTSLEQAMLEEPESVPLSLLQHRLLPHRPPLKVITRWGGTLF